MSASQLTKAAHDLLARTIGEGLAGGTMRIYGGRRGGESVLLAEPRFPEKFEVSQKDGERVIRFGEFSMVKCLAMGDMTWFRGYSKGANVALVEGSIGKRGADMTVDDERLYAGMELTLEGFEYAMKIQEGAA